MAKTHHKDEVLPCPKWSIVLGSTVHNTFSTYGFANFQITTGFSACVSVAILQTRSRGQIFHGWTAVFFHRSTVLSAF